MFALQAVELTILYAQLLIGIPLNFYAFYRLFLKRYDSPPQQSQRHGAFGKRFLLLQQHLNLSDLLVLLLFVPHQIAMQYTEDIWNACSTLCRLTKFWNNFAFHISSNVVICIAADRLISIYCRNSKLAPVRKKYYQQKSCKQMKYSFEEYIVLKVKN